MRLLFFLSLVLMATIGCNEQPNLESEVMAIHDEVMPKMGDIHAAKKKLKTILTETENDSVKTEILVLISDLEKADEGMMDWMSTWNVPEKEPEITAYLKIEKEKITKVKEDMLSSIEAANQFIQKSSK